MGIPLSSIKDPALVARIVKTMSSVQDLKQDLARECPKPKKSKRIRQDTKPLMNKLEQEYYDRFLKDKMDGIGHFVRPSIVCIQSIRFKLANGLWYKPDFFSPGVCGPVGIEIKGPHSFRGGFENLKVAASTYPWIKWILAWKDDNGHWEEQTVLP